MKKISFHDGWVFQAGIQNVFEEIMPFSKGREKVILPHDAMIYEKRNKGTASGKQTGYYPAKSYTYTKEFLVPEDWKEKTVILEFEGVAQTAQVFLNEERVAEHFNSYTGFNVETKGWLRYGEMNSLKVLAISNDLNSRWYPGAGIFRPVILHMGGKIHIVPDGIRIVAEEISGENAVLRISTDIHNSSNKKADIRIETKVMGEGGVVAAKSSQAVIKGRQGIISVI